MLLIRVKLVEINPNGASVQEIGYRWTSIFFFFVLTIIKS